jgi:acetaldehyde dehydrogenase
MNNTVYAVLEGDVELEDVTKSINEMITQVQQYVPGYRLKGQPYIDERDTPWGKRKMVVIMNEVEGAGDYFPVYAGNLDIMTAAAQRVGEAFAEHLVKEGARS